MGARSASKRLPISGANGRARGEVVGEGGGDAFVDGLRLQGLVVEQFAKRRECGVDVREPEQHELFESGFAVRQAVGCAA